MYSITIKFKAPSLLVDIKLTTHERFTKEELIERYNLTKEHITHVIIHEEKEVQNATV